MGSNGLRRVLGVAAAVAALLPAMPAAAAPIPTAKYSLAAFGHDHGWRTDKHVRTLVDVTRDGKADIVAFGDDGVWTSIALGDGNFSQARYVLAAYGYNSGWRIGTHPRWVTVQPAAGTVPAGSSMSLDVLFDATELADGDHAGSLRITSNDPDEPRVDVPCRFHVGVADATFDVDPNHLNPSSEGNWVAADLELGPGLDPLDIALPTLMLQRAVPVDAEGPISYRDEDEDGSLEVRCKFDRADLLAHLG